MKKYLIIGASLLLILIVGISLYFIVGNNDSTTKCNHSISETCECGENCKCNHCQNNHE